MTRPSLKNPAILLATWFGLGLIPKAPGTWGSLGAIPFAIILFYLTGIYGFLIACAVLTPIAFWATAAYENAAQSHDAKQIVIDEVIGQWIAFIPVFYFSGIHWVYVIAAFILFRFFDILKPWPISYIDKHMPGAIGVMCDDILAGIFAALILTGVIYAGFS